MNLVLIFDVIIAGLGIYMIYSAFQMKKTGEISNVIINELEVTKCKDRKSFIQSIYNQTVIFGAISVIFGVLGCINDTVFSLGKVFDIGGVFIFVGAWLWFTREVRKKKGEYFY